MTFPTEMLIDYVRVYQRTDSQNIGCNPKDYPTTDYISRHPEAYSSSFVGDEAQFYMLLTVFFTDAQLQSWTSGPAGANNTFPKNSLVRASRFRPPNFPDKMLERVVQRRLLVNRANATSF